MANDNKSSANIEREVQAQRDQVESRIGEIKDFIIAGAGEILLRKTIGPMTTFRPTAGRGGR